MIVDGVLWFAVVRGITGVAMHVDWPLVEHERPSSSGLHKI